MVAGAKYSYRQLDDFSELVAANIRTLPQVKRVLRSGVLHQQVNLIYSQERLASYDLRPDMIAPILNARNNIIPGGTLTVENMDIPIFPSGDFNNYKEIGDVPVALSEDGTPVYLRGFLMLRWVMNHRRLYSIIISIKISRVIGTVTAVLTCLCRC
ncbi:efflux RND transporter permease subunit [Microbulbifer sp. MLAF003]|uniref:efflux RND transporter permease subunit n=1 Tax=Microbulbifer sp. MLAF003 TaxID=3032582 RepID=UPI0024AD7150|nr:efflux RND transporter permease subunit [Microbulbifer sp. MLAF003]WHI53480.1 efflux RND transporter permease subunit [Microbulbifer sp. MLAF003]